MDTLSRVARSRVMSLIKQRDSVIEQRLRTALWRSGIRYRKNVRTKGTPDIVIGRSQLVIFVDSCFWHGCRYHCRMPKSNVRFWREKIARNQKRDRSISRFYRRRGWIVFRFWEHRLKRDFEGCVAKVLAYCSRDRKFDQNAIQQVFEGGERHFCHKNKSWTSPAMVLKSASAVTTRARRSDARAREKRWLVASGEWLVKVNGDHIARMKRAKGMVCAHRCRGRPRCCKRAQSGGDDLSGVKRHG